MTIMFIINARTIHNEDIYIAEIDDNIIWTQDISKMKIFKTPGEAANLLSKALSNIELFENYNLAVSTSIKISQLLIKELY